MEQGNTPNNKLSLDNDRRQCNFDFEQTQEGHYFWSQIDKGNTKYFYTLYPKPLELNYEIY